MSTHFDHEKFIDHLSIDCVIFGYDKGKLKVLVAKLKTTQAFWALPGGFILYDEGIDDAAHRILKERTGLSNVFLQQFRVFGGSQRAERNVFEDISRNSEAYLPSTMRPGAIDWLKQRFISIGYYALVDINKVVPKALDLDESIDWFQIENLPSLIMDHKEQVLYALKALQLNLDEKLLGYNLLPEQFTMKELQQLYETVYDRAFRRNNFQKRILDLDILERLEKKFTGAPNKAPYLYRFNKIHYQKS